MNERCNRRGFLKTAGILGTGLSIAAMGRMAHSGETQPTTAFPNAESLGWHLSASQYTFRRFALDQSLGMIESLGFRHVEPAFFLKLDSKRPALKVNEALSAKDRQQLKAQLADHGIDMASYYVNLTGDRKACIATFEFAKEMGVQTLVAEPPASALGMIEKLCDRYAINLAIHNHPKPSSKYWDPDAVVAACKGRGKHIGACCDVGHWARSGLDTVACLKKLEGRIIELHLKDVIETGNPKARDVPLGTGKANFRAVLEELKRQKFHGLMVVEYEHDSPKLEQETAQCAAFVETTAKQLR